MRESLRACKAKRAETQAQRCHRHFVGCLDDLTISYAREFQNVSFNTAPCLIAICLNSSRPYCSFLHILDALLGEIPEH